MPSQTFEDVSRAVVIDTDLNIAHDPNPNQRALNLTADDVEGFYCIKLHVIGKTGKLYAREQWDAVSEEEHDENIWKLRKDENGNYIKY